MDTIWLLAEVTKGLWYRLERAKSRSGQRDAGGRCPRVAGPLSAVG